MDWALHHDRCPSKGQRIKRHEVKDWGTTEADIGVDEAKGAGRNLLSSLGRNKNMLAPSSWSSRPWNYKDYISPKPAAPSQAHPGYMHIRDIPGLSEGHVLPSLGDRALWVSTGLFPHRTKWMPLSWRTYKLGFFKEQPPHKPLFPCLSVPGSSKLTVVPGGSQHQFMAKLSPLSAGFCLSFMFTAPPSKCVPRTVMTNYNHPPL